MHWKCDCVVSSTLDYSAVGRTFQIRIIVLGKCLLVCIFTGSRVFECLHIVCFIQYGQGNAFVLISSGMVKAVRRGCSCPELFTLWACNVTFNLWFYPGLSSYQWGFIRWNIHLYLCVVICCISFTSKLYCQKCKVVVDVCVRVRCWINRPQVVPTAHMSCVLYVVVLRLISSVRYGV